MPLLGGAHDPLATSAVKALLHGGPLDDSWWTINADDDDDPPRILVPQPGLGADAEPLLLADFPVPVGGWRYELGTRDDGRVVYVWAPDERPQLEFVAVCQDGPAAGYRMDVLGLTEPWRYMRLVRRPALGPLDGGHMEWMHIPWPDTPGWPDEVCYELTGTFIPPSGGIAEASYRLLPDKPRPVIAIRDRQR
jgi:hypothetical protein